MAPAKVTATVKSVVATGLAIKGEEILTSDKAHVGPGCGTD
jgi:hypothetical protein